MADVITRFKLETSQYDSKLRDASKELADIGKKAAEAGRDFDKFAKDSLESAKALGSIATTATTTKGKVQELVGAYNDVAKAYNKLTEDQKQSDFGKAMAGSLQELQGRIKEAKSELYGLGDSGKNTGGIMGQLADKFTINIDALKLFNMGLQGAKAALGVTKDALFASEATVDEWGRIVQSSESLYNGFLTALNTGDISGYLSRIDSIVAAARKAYDELDTLGSMKTIQGPEMSRQETENSRLRMMVQTGRYIASYDGGSNPWGLQNGDQLNAEQIRAIEQQLQEGMNKIVALTDNEVKQTGNAIEAYYDSLAKQNGMSVAEFKRGTKTWEDFSSRMEGYQKYLDFEREHTTTTSTYSPSAGMVTSTGRDNAINPYAEYANWGVFRVDKMGSNSYNDLVNLIKQQQSQVSQMYSTMGQAYRVINRAEGTTVRSIMNGGSGGTGSTGGNSTTSKETYIPAIGSIDEMKAKVKELQDEFNKTADQSIRGQLLVAIDEAQKKLDYMTGKGLTLVERPKGSLSEHLGFGVGSKDKPKNEQQDDLKKVKIPKELIESKSTTNKETKSEIKAITEGVTGILGGLTKMGVELPEGLSQMIGTMQVISGILTSILTITTLIQGTQQVGSVFSVLDAIIPFARGGIVRAAGGTIIPGNSYSGDNLRMPIMDGIGGWAGVNSGELILNRSQQDRIASQLSNGGMQNLHLTATIKGTDIQLALNNTARRQGRGTYVTSR